jgi:demethylmenaquinone methyltransferase / 2-methoxy-6-polyprenyl-1,4-benzoquinol methylase
MIVASLASPPASKLPRTLGASAQTSVSPRKRHALQLFAGLPAAYNWMGAVLSFGQDPIWRQALIRAMHPRPGLRVLDVATGTGMVAFALAARGCEVVALDQSEDMLGVARRRLLQRPELSDRLKFMHGEAESLPFDDGVFDALTFTYLLRYVDDRPATMHELARVVKPGGRIGMVEFAVPEQPQLRAAWRLHTRVGLPLIGRLVSRSWFEVGRFLGPNIEEFHVNEPDLTALWRAAGLEDVHERRRSFGAGVVVSATKALVPRTRAEQDDETG